MKLEADIRYKAVIPRAKSFEKASLILLHFQDQEALWDLPHGVITLSGSKDWKAYQIVIGISPDIKEIRIIAELRQSSGLFEIRNLKLYPVKKSLLYPIVQKSVLIIWALYIIFLFYPLFITPKNTDIIKTFFLISVILILIGVSISGKNKIKLIEMSKSLTPFSNNLTIENEIAFKNICGIEFNIHISKIYHFFFFIFFGILLSYLNETQLRIHLMLYLLIFAGSTELIQTFTAGRTPLAFDFVIDCAGGLTGFFSTSIIKKFYA